MNLSKYSFGTTSAITTSLALIIGLNAAVSPKLTVISALLVLAIADNISDSFGMHIYQESCDVSKRTRKGYSLTLTNFLSRLSTTFCFVLIILFLPPQLAQALSVILGLSILSIMSYFIAKNQKTNAYLAVFEHLGIAVLVMLGSYFLGLIIRETFK